MGGRGSGSGATQQKATAQVGTPQNPASNGFTGVKSGTDLTNDATLPATVQSRSPQAIMDAMDAQGFRGRPKVVTDQAEFDKAIQAAWGGQGLEVVRGIGAPDDTTLAAYRDSLTDGDWYVSCGGGAVHGYGQYGAYRHGGKVQQGDVDEAKSYARWNGGPKTHVYHYTLDPSARIGEESRLRSDMQAHNANAQAQRRTLQRQAADSLITQYKKGTRAEKAVAKQWDKGVAFPAPSGGASAQYKKDFRAAATKLQNTVSNVKGPQTFRDVGVFAAAKGYDFYYDRRSGYSVALNRTKLIVLKDW